MCEIVLSGTENNNDEVLRKNVKSVLTIILAVKLLRALKIYKILTLQGRGSRNPSTGPATDRSSFIYGGMEGGYTYLDSSYPRRPGDSARLSSVEFDPTG